MYLLYLNFSVTQKFCGMWCYVDWYIGTEKGYSILTWIWEVEFLWSKDWADAWLLSFQSFPVVASPLKIQVYEVKIIDGYFYGYHLIMLLFTILYILTQRKSSMIF